MNRHESRAYERGKKARVEGKLPIINRPYRTLPPKAQKRVTLFNRGWKAMDAMIAERNKRDD